MGLKNAASVYEFKALVTAQAEAQEELDEAVASENWDDAYEVIEAMENRVTQLKGLLEDTEKEVE